MLRTLLMVRLKNNFLKFWLFAKCLLLFRWVLKHGLHKNITKHRKHERTPGHILPDLGRMISKNCPQYMTVRSSNTWALCLTLAKEQRRRI